MIRSPMRCTMLTPALALIVACQDPAEPVEFRCEPPDIATTGWVEVTGPGVRFLLPGRFTSAGGGNWTSDRDWVRIVAVSPGPGSQDPTFELINYRSCSTEIGGRTALLENGSTERGPQIDQGFYIAATWTGVVLGPLSPPQRLVLSGFAIDRDEMLEIFRAIHTLEFTFSGGGGRPVVSVSPGVVRS